MLASMIGLAAYILGALGFYAIATRRGIKHAWLAWVPIGNLWLLGCVSDQYQYLAKGKVKRKRKVLLGLSIGYGLCIIALLVLCFSMIFQLFTMDGFLPDVDVDYGIYEDEMYPDDMYEDMYEDMYGDISFEDLPVELVGIALSMAGAGGLLALLTIPMLVVQYMALYDLFRSCDPDNATLFLLLSIFLNISSFLVFAIREKDYGIPRPAPVQPVYQAPCEEPTAPPQPIVEPWEQKTEE